MPDTRTRGEKLADMARMGTEHEADTAREMLARAQAAATSWPRSFLSNFTKGVRGAMPAIEVSLNDMPDPFAHPDEWMAEWRRRIAQEDTR